MLFLYFTALHMVFMAITRYRLPLEPFLIILASWGGLSLLTSSANRESKIENRK
jgi:hypothetical protein